MEERELVSMEEEEKMWKTIFALKQTGDYMPDYLLLFDPFF